MKLPRIRKPSPRVGIAAAALVLAVSVVSGRQFVDSAADASNSSNSSATSAAINDGARGGDARSPAADAADFNLDGLRREVSEGHQVVADIFAPPQAEPVVSEPSAAPPSTPQAPELPFRYAGRILDGRKASVFLLKGAEAFSVSPGDRIGQDYRLLGMNESELTFVYLPMGKRQKLSLAAAAPQPAAQAKDAGAAPPQAGEREGRAAARP
jgi:hypothetical protein